MKFSAAAWVVSLPFILTASSLAAPAASQRKPNVILIVADDLGYADLGCQQQSTDVKTPNIDSIAANGVRFTNGYVSCPVCSPTRAGLLTGRYQQRFGFEWNPKGPSEENVFGLPLDQVTLPQRLKQVGYATGMVGKWHLGNGPEMHPNRRGFDEFFGFIGGAHGYVNNDNPKPGDKNVIQRNGEPVTEKDYLTDAFTREAVAFIDRHKDQPFFLYLPYNAPHSPMQASQKYLSRFPDEQDEKRRTFLAMLSALDDGVGQILAKLRDAKIEENTLLVFFSDNGGPTLGNASVNTPFSGTKGSTFEGGVRVPFMMQWKGRLPAGKVDDRVVVQLDLFPTALDLAGAKPPADTKLDGKDLIPYLAGNDAGVIHDALFWRFGPRRGMRSGNWKLQWNGDAKPALYDLTVDPAEKNDLAEQKPEVVKELMAAYQKWDDELMAPRWEGRLEGNGARMESAGEKAPATKRGRPRRQRAAPPAP